jgi:hypothetical protein
VLLRELGDVFYTLKAGLRAADSPAQRSVFSSSRAVAMKLSTIGKVLSTLDFILSESSVPVAKTASLSASRMAPANLPASALPTNSISDTTVSILLASLVRSLSNLEAVSDRWLSQSCQDPLGIHSQLGGTFDRYPVADRIGGCDPREQSEQSVDHWRLEWPCSCQPMFLLLRSQQPQWLWRLL